MITGMVTQIITAVITDTTTIVAIEKWCTEMSLGTSTAAELRTVDARGQGHTPTISTRITPRCTMKQGLRGSPRRMRGKCMTIEITAETSIIQLQMPTRVPKRAVMCPSHPSDSRSNSSQRKRQRLQRDQRLHNRSQKLLMRQEVRQIKKRFRKICWLFSKSTMTIILMDWKSKSKLNLNQRKFKRLKIQLQFQHKPKTLLRRTQSSLPRRPRKALIITAEQLKTTMAMMRTQRLLQANQNLSKLKRKYKVKKPRTTTKLTPRANTAPPTALTKRAKIVLIKGK